MEAMYRSGRDVAHTVALLTRGQALYMRSEEFYKSSVVRVSRSRGHLASSRRMVQNFATRKPDVVRALIRQQIRLGRLPVHSFPILTGGPGGGMCSACGGCLTMTRLVMALPEIDGRPNRVHADCYIVWDQLRRSSQ
jgi:hypothetical protein